MKKGQMEIMGLAIIVVLIILGILFAINLFATKKSNTDVQSEFRTSEYGANFLNALVETNSPHCFGASFSKLFIDCADNNGVNGRIICTLEDGSQKRSCEYLRQKTWLLLNQTLGKWGVNYVFVATRSPTDQNQPADPGDPTKWLFYPVKRNIMDYSLCTGERKPTIQPLPANDPIDLWLYICQ